MRKTLTAHAVIHRPCRHPSALPVVLLLYEGGATSQEEAKVRIALGLCMRMAWARGRLGPHWAPLHAFILACCLPCAHLQAHPAAATLNHGCRCVCASSTLRTIIFLWPRYPINISWPPNIRSPQVRVRLVDFAHTFQAEGGARDTNFLAGLRALLARLRAVVHAQLQQELT